MNTAIIGLAFVAIILLVVTYLTWRSRKDGEEVAKARQSEAIVDAVKERKESDDAVDRLTADERRKRLRQWSSD